MQPSPGIRNALAVLIALLLLAGVALAALQPDWVTGDDDDVVAPAPVTTTTTTAAPPDEPAPDEPPPDEPPPDDEPPDAEPPPTAAPPTRPPTGMDTPGVARPVDGLADTGGGPLAVAGLGALALGLAARRTAGRARPAAPTRG